MGRHWLRFLSILCLSKSIEGIIITFSIAETTFSHFFFLNFTHVVELIVLTFRIDDVICDLFYVTHEMVAFKTRLNLHQLSNCASV